MASKELLNIDATQYQLTVDRMEDIKKPFLPMADKFKTYIEDINNVIKESEKEITPVTVAKAKRLKLDIAKVRTGTGKIKDTSKQGIIQEWNAIQKCHNMIVDVVKEKEVELDKIVKHFENQEVKRKYGLQISREQLLLPYEVQGFEALNLGEMQEAVFDNFLIGCKSAFEAKQAQAKKLEDDRIAKEKVDEEEKKKVAKENAKLKKDAAEAKAKQDKIDAKRKYELEKERAEAKVKQDKADAELKKANDAKEKLQKEATAKANAENKRKSDKEFADQAEFVKEEKEKARIKKEQESEEYQKKVAEYNVWKKSHEGKFDIELKEDGKMVLYKKVSEFVFE